MGVKDKPQIDCESDHCVREEPIQVYVTYSTIQTYTTVKVVERGDPDRKTVQNSLHCKCCIVNGTQILLLTTFLVKFSRIVNKFLFRPFLVKKSIDNDWNAGENHIVQFFEVYVVEGLTRPSRIGRVHKQRHRQHDILVKTVQDEVRVSSMTLSSVIEQQRLEVLKLTNRVICAWSSLRTLQTWDSNSDCRLRNHRHIISPVTDRQNSSLWSQFAK